jgi:arylformamidase
MILPVRGWGTDQQAWDRAYVAGTSVPDVGAYVAEYAERSARARAALTWQQCAYGADPAQRLHLFPAAGQDAPLLVFVHGGYWQELTEAESSFAAQGVVAAGAAFAALGYGLAPAHRLPDIAAMVGRAVRWLHTQGFQPDRTMLVGHSAGAHLALMSLLAEPGLARAAVLLSGLYELGPICHTSVGRAIGLTAEQAVANSPVRQLRADLPPLVVARGADEPVGFADQQTCLVRQATRLGLCIVDSVVPDRNHFDLPYGLGDQDDPVGSMVAAQLFGNS